MSSAADDARLAKAKLAALAAIDNPHLDTGVRVQQLLANDYFVTLGDLFDEVRHQDQEMKKYTRGSPEHDSAKQAAEVALTRIRKLMAFA